MNFYSRFFATILFAVAMIWTWNLIHSTNDLETHAAIKEKLIGYIETIVKAQRPKMTDFKMEKMWTEAIRADLMKAHFTYAFQDLGETGEKILTRISGEGDLNKKEGTEDTWVLTKVSTNANALEFNEGITINASDVLKNPSEKAEDSH